MNADAFTTAYGELRNGANGFIRHPLSRKFIYSDGVQECAEAGCYWLLDILATELPGLMREGDFVLVAVTVADGQADITGKWTDAEPPRWTKHIDFTDMPAGQWKFFVTHDGLNVTCILPNEY